jgi:hypothetical protein
MDEHRFRNSQPGSIPSLKRLEFILANLNRLVGRQKNFRSHFGSVLGDDLDFRVRLSMDEINAALPDDLPQYVNVPWLAGFGDEIPLVRLSQLKTVFPGINSH